VLKRIGKTYLSYGATFLLSTVLLYLEVDVWQWSAVIAPVANLLITIPLNFLLNKFWAFK
jgi:putative flippase GtrA